MLKLMNFVIILVILCEGIHSINGEALQCHFQDFTFIWGAMYTCRVSSLDNSKNDKFIRSYTGTHLANKNVNDVKAIYIHDTNTKYIPEGLGSLFNLIAFVVESSELLEIKEENFRGMQNMEYLSLTYNKFTSIPSDAFSSLTKLKIIVLYNNQIKYIGTGAFDQLTNLSILYLHDNICVNKPYVGAAAITQMKKDIKENCLTSTERMLMQMEKIFINEIAKANEKNQGELNSLNEMVKTLLNASEGHQIEQQENIKLREELSKTKDLLMKANDQQKTSKDEKKTEQEANTNSINEVTKERDQLIEEITDLKTINNTLRPYTHLNSQI